MNDSIATKIANARIKSLAGENRELKRKFGNARIALNCLNNEVMVYGDLLVIALRLLEEHNVPQTPDAIVAINRLQNFAIEQDGSRMTERIDAILKDETGDDVLLDDLFNPPENTTDE